MYHFFAEHENTFEEEGYIDIVGGDVNHIKNVLRLKTGDEVLVSTGDNLDYSCLIDSLSDELVRVTIKEKREKTNELPIEVYLFQGLPKQDKMELIIQKCVELGMTGFYPVSMKRCIVKLDKKKADNKIKRWNEISLSAAKQSKRSIIPKVESPMSFTEALKEAGKLDKLILPYECADGMAHTKDVVNSIKPGDKVGIFIGPEGGFDRDELDRAIEAGCEIVTLGKRILRTETAGLMLMSVLMYNFEE
ncbi:MULTISPECIES: 16S rRNA (uracil(1498)-N(3))-methyltransferase [Lachnospira]|jgi:16S rRNA (uracil1498-N3)-methyltransferase|uniref:Ribosomal RNA small subunit methyltransferase E n=2 Tax=Lachnospira TaxID=28050 RepID=A0A1H5RS18_9FIRM|nr:MULTISPECIES: 16S rRNA (uracil(1498)-N(3))-methyltransferase [Lachnospira]SDM75559.1 16S rRNA (uracil1498-N3)-methyltransferase [Lachnospira pectinoschiza]SEF40924.1 16S rRNA (uracil1498-N3)-methyltransferase [Lachnospira multipara]